MNIRKTFVRMRTQALLALFASPELRRGIHKKTRIDEK